MWRVGRLGDDSHLVLRPDFTEERSHLSRCAVVVQLPGLVSPPSGLFLSASLRHSLQHLNSLGKRQCPGDRFTLPHILDDELKWCDRAGVRLKQKVTAT
jgi:hypothetical protein